MSWSSRILASVLSLTLAACGFSPVYGPTGSGGTLQNAVEVSEPDSLEGYLITRRLEERLGRAGAADYRLVTTVSTRREALAVNRENNTNRYNLVGEATYQLVETGTGQVVTSGVVTNFTGSSATGTTVATLAAERDARERLMTLLADQIVARLLSADLA